MLSAPPDKKTVQSLNFLKMSSASVCCLLASLFVISALMSVIRTLLRRGVSTPKEFLHRFLDNLWRICLLFFFEPIIRTNRILSWRIVVSVWLIAVSFVYIEMCSHLNSKFTQTEYSYVDSVATLPRDRYRDVIVLKDYVEEAFVNKMAEVDDNYRELKTRMRRLDEMEFLLDDPFEKFFTNVVIIAEFMGKLGLKEVSNVMPQVPSRGRIYFSEPLYKSFIVLPIASNASRRTVDAINNLCVLEMETKVISNFLNEMDFSFFGMRWIKPTETFQDTTFSDVKSVLDLFLFGIIMAAILLVVEFAIRIASSRNRVE